MGGLGEVDSDDLDKIAGVARHQAAEISSSLPRSTNHGHTASLDGGDFSCGGPGGQKDGGGAKGFFAHVLEDRVALRQLSVLVSADPGAEGEGSADQVCGGEISSSISDDGKTFMEPRQTSRQTKSTRALRDSFLAAAIAADGMGPDSVPDVELQAGYVAQPGSSRPDDAQGVCQEDSNLADLPGADQVDGQTDSNSAIRQEAHQAVIQLNVCGLGILYDAMEKEMQDLHLSFDTERARSERLE
ncbi:hypothetical protein ZWY2020_029008 [Hordeum vulgare]|nr:hypothetical protein ZWY2020_029008 [Hordeum vulgare]